MHRVVVMDPDRMTRQALARVLTRSDLLRVVHASGRLDAAHRTHPPSDAPAGASAEVPVDVVLATRSYPDPELMELARSLRRRGGPALVLAGLPPVDSVVLRFAECGAAGFVRHGEGAEEMLAVVEAVARNETRLSGRLARSLLERLAELCELCEDEGLDPSLLRHLTPRESEVLALVARARTNREIARQLGVSSGTVKSHVHRILTKLQVSNRDDAGRYFRLCSPERERATER